MSSVLAYLPHILVGTAILLTFWATLLSFKGSIHHKRRGRLYLLLLIPLLASVVPITLRAAAEEGPVRIVQLLYLSVVVAAAGWTAWRAVRDRDDLQAFRGPIYVGLALVLSAMAVLLLVMGIVTQNIMAFGFSIIGIVYGGAMLGFIGQAASQNWWLHWHLNGIALLFAATHASFTGLVLRTLNPAWDGEVLHGLTQFGVIALAYFFRQWLSWRYEAAALREHAIV
ncbi:MAG: hypothetical protein R3F54_05195 [Alphaproteobacteria bacterium]